MGIMSSLLLDLNCDFSFEPIDLPYATGLSGYSEIESINLAPHTPSAIHADPGSAYMYALSVSGHALWGLYLRPGRSLEGLRLISAAEPGIRNYSIIPAFENNELWAYTEDDDDNPDIPWKEDFTVNGMIVGPGCPAVTEAPGPGTKQ
jgi:hypothetical protein